MITASQIRSARAMLDWKQSDLAAKTGLSLPSINSIERNIGSPRISTLTLIKGIFENEGIEFIGTTGLQKRTEVFEIKEFNGESFMRRLNEDLFLCMQSAQDEVLLFGVDDRMWESMRRKKPLDHYDHQKKTAFKERMLFKHGDEYLLSNVHACRWTLPETVGIVPYYVYKDRVAMVMWEKKRVVLIKSKDIADSYRAQYEFLWAQSKPIPKTVLNKLEDPALPRKVEKSKTALIITSINVM